MDLIKEKELRADTLVALMRELIMEDVAKPEKNLGHTEEPLALVADRLTYAMNKSNKPM